MPEPWIAFSRPEPYRLAVDALRPIGRSRHAAPLGHDQFRFLRVSSYPPRPYLRFPVNGPLDVAFREALRTFKGRAVADVSDWAESRNGSRPDLPNSAILPSEARDFFAPVESPETLPVVELSPRDFRLRSASQRIATAARANSLRFRFPIPFHLAFPPFDATSM